MKLLHNVLMIAFMLSLNYFNVLSSDEESNPQAGIIEKLDNVVSGDIKITKSDGSTVNFSELITKPTVISLVYFNCPGICSPLLGGLQELVEKSDIIPGKDYNVLSISFDHKEDSELASKWKKNYIGALKREIPESSWEFLTMDSINTQKLTNEVGFYFIPDRDNENDYLHQAALIVLSPDRKITRYLFGTKFLPFDLKMAVIEAERGESRPTINKILELCFKYDADGRKYVLNVTRIVGVVMMLTLGIFITYLVIKGKKDRGESNV